MVSILDSSYKVIATRANLLAMAKAAPLVAMDFGLESTHRQGMISHAWRD